MSFGGILEKLLLNESATPEQICKAIDNHSYVIINYHTDGKDDNTGSRIILPVAYGLTSASNPVLRAYQPMGDSTTKAKRWKYFRLDRISYWEETKNTFDESDLPDESDNVGTLNLNGDDTMKTVNHVISFTHKVDGANGVNVGPKTKEKVHAVNGPKITDTEGDRNVRNGIGKRNIKNQKANIKVDIENNKKANSTFNMYTPETQSIEAGPRVKDQSYSPRNVSGRPENGDINNDELKKLRRDAKAMADRSDILSNDDYWKDMNNTEYSHDYNDDEWNRFDIDDRVLNRKSWQNKDLSTSKRKLDRAERWMSSSDSMKKWRKGSGNEILKQMDDDKHI